MTRHHTPSPEDRFNDFLDALASGRSTPDASDGSADTNAEPAMPGDAARELHQLARSADARHGSPPDSIWETIMMEGATAATPARASNHIANPWPDAGPSATPVPSRNTKAPASVQATPDRPGAGRRSSIRWLGHFRPALSAAILLAIIVGVVALEANWHPSWNDEPPLARLPALSGGLPATPFGTPVPDVNACLANNGLAYRTDALSDSGDLTLKQATSIDGDDEIVSTSAATTVFDSGVPNVAIGIGNGVYTAMNLATSETTTLGYGTNPRPENILFGPWVVAPLNEFRTDWTVTYLPTMEQTAVGSILVIDEPQPYSVAPKVSADGSTLALVITPDDPDKGEGSVRRVEPSVLILTKQATTGLFTKSLPEGDFATMANLVALSRDGSKLSLPAISRIGTNKLQLSLVIWDISGPSINFLIEQPLDDHIDEGFAFFSPSGAALNYAVDGTVGTVAVDKGTQPVETGTYDGALYGAVIAPGGEGALVGLRQTSAESPSTWIWLNGRTGAVETTESLENFMFAHTPVSPETPRVIVDQIVELTRSDHESGPSLVFFDPATGSPANELRDPVADRVGGSVGANWMNASTDGAIILLRLDDEAIIKVYRPSTGERWNLPTPEGVSPTSLATFPSPDGSCIAMTSEASWQQEGPPPIWVVTAQPGAEPVKVAEGWFANWYQAPVSTGP